MNTPDEEIVFYDAYAAAMMVPEKRPEEVAEQPAGGAPGEDDGPTKT